MMPFLLAQVAGGATPLDPQTQGTLVSWYDASTLGLANGASVATWKDSKTGNPYQLSKQGFPLYSTPAQNGLGTVDLVTGGGSYFTGGPDSSTYPYTIAAVISLNGSSSGTRAIVGSLYGGGIEFRVDNSTNYLTVVNAYTAGIGTGTTGVSTSGYHLVVVTVTSSTYAFYIDGAAAGSGSHSTSLTSGKTFVVGQSKGYPGDDYFTGYIGEVQIYSSELSSGDLAALHAYAVSKWATP